MKCGNLVEDKIKKYFLKGMPEKMKYYYKEGKSNSPIFILLHGTGGDEFDLLSLATLIDPDATILSFRGDVNEYGNLRFFKRHANGMFDIEDLKMRTDKMYTFIYQLAEKFDFKLENVFAIGYSNGANMIASLILSKQIPFKGAILMHPILSRKDVSPKKLSNMKILITAGVNDPLCPTAETNTLAKVLSKAKANVNVKWFDFGHKLTIEEINAAKEWYEKSKVIK